MKKILFISTTNLTSNPRILKEILLANSNGFSVQFVGFKIGNWSDNIDDSFDLEKKGIACTYLDATRKHFFKWLTSSLIEKFCRIIYPLSKNNLFVVAYAHNKRSWLLNQYLKKNTSSYNFIVAHTLGAYYPANQLAKKNKIKFAFDVEDFHPEETIHSDVVNEKERRNFLLKIILQQAYYISCASPLVEKAIKERFAVSNTKNLFTINNFFSSNEFVEPATNNVNTEKLKFVWFSQNINAGRGLELFIPILQKYKQQISLELIGKIDDSFYESYVKSNTDWINISLPMPQKKLHEYLSSFDIGLAADLSMADYNREIAITNKILAYFQAGIFIVATNTLAQQQFLSIHANAGVCVKQNQQSIDEGIANLLNNKSALCCAKNERFLYAKKFCWENESTQILKNWQLV